MNDQRWTQDAALSAWIARARLNLFGVPPATADAAMIEGAQRLAAVAVSALATLQRLLATEGVA